MFKAENKKALAIALDELVEDLSPSNLEGGLTPAQKAKIILDGMVSVLSQLAAAGVASGLVTEAQTADLAKNDQEWLDQLDTV